MQGQQGTLHGDVERTTTLKTGETLHYDYRSEILKDSLLVSPSQIRPLKVIQWNIERGIKLDGIIDTLRELDADIIALQEIDSGLSRSEYIDTGVAIAHTLGLNYVFQCEFIELEGDIDKKYFYSKFHNKSNSNRVIDPSIERNDPTYQATYRKHPNKISIAGRNHDQNIQFHPTPVPTSSTYKYAENYAVQAERPGVHGNCILTKLNISQIISVNHKHHPYNWERDGVLLNEPRQGERQTLCCVVDVPTHYVANKVDRKMNEDTFYFVSPPNDGSEDDMTPVDIVHVPIYTCHFELFCGMVDRFKIFAEILGHYRKTFLHPNKSQFQSYGMLLGDLNTLGHSVARLSPKYCKDSLRWKTLGYTEAEWWYKYILDSYQYNHYIDNNSNPQQQSQKDQKDQKQEDDTTMVVSTPLSRFDLSPSSLTPDDYLNLINPGFEEPFEAQSETLIDYNGWFYGKLDWTLIFGLHVINTDLFNLDYTTSDHRGLLLECFLKSPMIEQIAPIDPFLSSSSSSSSSSLIDSHTQQSKEQTTPIKPLIPHHLLSNFRPNTYLIFPTPQTKGKNITTSSKISLAIAPDEGSSNAISSPLLSSSSTTTSSTLLSSSTTGRGTISKQHHPHSVTIYAQNQYYTVYPIVRNFIQGYHDETNWLQRNFTPYLQHAVVFIIPTIIAIIYILSFASEA